MWDVYARSAEQSHKIWTILDRSCKHGKCQKLQANIERQNGGDFARVIRLAGRFAAGHCNCMRGERFFGLGTPNLITGANIRYNTTLWKRDQQIQRYMLRMLC